MSEFEQNFEGADPRVPLDDDAAFSFLMDTMAPEEGEQEAAAGDAPADAPAAGDGSPAPAPEGTGATEAPAGAPVAGDAGGDGVPPAAPAEPAGDAGGAAALDAATLEPKWGEVLTSLESRQTTALQAESLEEVREEFQQYFEAIQKHPRMLVGTEVPSLKGEGMETLRDSQDAKDWQEAVKQELSKEISDRVSRKVDDQRPLMETLHNSVELFRTNPDLIPNTKQFDRELADKFAELVQPYELRVNGKLQGYTIPVQPFVTQLRQQLTASRAAAAAAPAAPSPQQQRAQQQQRNDVGQFATDEEAPQAGIPSRAGQSSDDGEDFSTLFGTIGLPTLRI